MMKLSMHAGWLDDISTWLAEAISKVWDAFASFMEALFFVWLKSGMDMMVMVLQHIPAPDFLSAQSIGSLLGESGPQVLWFVTVFQVPASSVVIGAAIVFYFARRILTLGIW